MKITYLGHGSISIDAGGKNLLIDPFITGNPLAGDINVDDLNPDYILITHGHQDHILDVERIAQRNKTMLISNFEIISWFAKKDLPGHAMNHGGKFNFEFGTLKYVNAIHTSMLPDGANGGNPGGFVIWNTHKCIYVAGDTALTEDMKLIPLTCPRLDIAVLPIGDNFTMGYEDASIASDFIQCDRIVGYHYDTFPPIKIDKDAAKSHFTAHNKELMLPEIRETIEV